MPFSSSTYRVFIASPGDAASQRSGLLLLAVTPLLALAVAMLLKSGVEAGNPNNTLTVNCGPGPSTPSAGQSACRHGSQVLTDTDAAGMID